MAISSASPVFTGKDPAHRLHGPLPDVQGDAGYEACVLDAPGPRHRLWLSADEWRYERS